MKKNALLTFDYEVFLGRKTGTIDNSVIKPTESVLRILEENNAKAIFFVDTTWLIFLKENFPLDFNLVSEQLKNIIKAGSSVELHLHPQWISAYKISDSIIFNSLFHYRLHSMTTDDIYDLFGDSIKLLKSITNQNINCFRAGGWCIEPFCKLENVFKQFSIKYDFSVLPGMSLKENQKYDYDFTYAPKLSFYNFQHNVNKAEPLGEFVEVPGSTFHNNIIYRVFNKILLKISKDKIFGDGIGIKEKSIYKSLYQGLKSTMNLLTLDKTSYIFFRYLLATHFNKSESLVIVSHPKTVSRQALKNLIYITKNYNTINSTELDSIFKI